MKELKKNFKDAGFVAPRSLIGRAVLVLFAFPAVATVVSYFLFFVYAAYRARARLLAYGRGELDLPKSKGYCDNFDYLLGYVYSVGNRFMMYFYAYLDRVLTFGVFCGIVWLFVRMRRNGTFSAKQWFNVMFYGWVLFMLRGLSFCAWGFFDGGGSIMGGIHSIVYYITTTYLAFISVRAAFLSQTSEAFVSWKDGISERAFFSQNISAVKKLVGGFRVKFIVIGIAALILFDYIFWTLQGV